MKSSARVRLENVLGYRLMLPGSRTFRPPWQYTSPAARQWPRWVATLSLLAASQMTNATSDERCQSNEPTQRNNFGLDLHIIPEPNTSGRIVLWIPGKRELQFQYWERVASVAGADAEEYDNLCPLMATA